MEAVLVSRIDPKSCREDWESRFVACGFISCITQLLQIAPEQCIQAHSILRTISHKFSEQAVLVLGGTLDTVRRVANECVMYITLGFDTMSSLHTKLWLQEGIYNC